MDSDGNQLNHQSLSKAFAHQGFTYSGSDSAKNETFFVSHRFHQRDSALPVCKKTSFDNLSESERFPSALTLCHRVSVQIHI